MSNEEQVSRMLRALAEEIPTSAPVVLPAPRQVRGRPVALGAAAAIALVIGGGVAISGSLSKSESYDENALLSRSPAMTENAAPEPRPDMQELVRSGVSVGVPSAWTVYEQGGCDAGGLGVNAAVRTDGPLEPCLGFRAAGATRVYLVDLSAPPPYEESWESVTTPDGTRNGVAVRRVTSGSMGGTSSAVILAITIPSRSVGVVVAGPDPQQVMRVLDGVRILGDD